MGNGTGKDFGLGMRIVAAFILLTIVLSFVGTNTAKAEEARRLISVVFDDSGSMKSYQRWYRAKYALEVFAAMLSEQDELEVCALNSKETLKINGKDKDRVSKMHTWGIGQTRGDTPFGPVTDAANRLISAKGTYTDRWLIVLTDGDFIEGTNHAENKMKEWSRSGIKVVYLSIGSGASAIPSDTQNNRYSYAANQSSDILSQVRDIANRIFERLVLPKNHYRTSGKTYTLNIDVPTRSILVFAQGSDVKIGSLQAGGKTFQPNELLDVKFVSTNKTIANWGDADRSLKGVVAIYKAPSATQPFEAADFTIDIADGKEVEFYYDPFVEVDCQLWQGNTTVPKGSTIDAGKFKVTGAFIDPRTNNEVKSDLLKPERFSLTLDNNGTKKEFSSGSGDVELKPGKVTITAAAEFKTTTLISKKDYTVRDSNVAIEPETSNDASIFSIRQDQLKNNKQIGFDVIIVDSETKQPVTEERWRKTELEIEDQDGIHWTWTKNGKTSPYVHLTPSAVDKYSAVKTGKLTVKAVTVYNKDKQTRMESTFQLEIVPFEPIQLYPVSEQISQKTLKDKAASYTVRIGDRYSNGALMTGAKWNYVKNVTITNGNGIVWDCQRGPGEGEYTLTPGSADGQLQSVKPGTYPFTVTAVYDDGDLIDWSVTETLSLEVTYYPPKDLSITVDVPGDPYLQCGFSGCDARTRTGM